MSVGKSVSNRTSPERENAPVMSAFVTIIFSFSDGIQPNIAIASDGPK